MSIRLIAIDIDGTLMSSSGTAIGRRNLQALRAAEAAGIEVAIATGRRHAFAMPLIAPLGLNPAAVIISSNGAVVKGMDGVLVLRKFLTSAAAVKLAKELRSYGTMVFTFDREGAGGLVVENLCRLHRRLDRWVDANRPHLVEVDPVEQAFSETDLPVQGMVCGTLEEMEKAEYGLRLLGLDRECAMHRTEYAARGLSILDLLPHGCSKGAALEHVTCLRGLEPGQVMAIGDNLNDVEMLEYAGRAVVMANANEAVRSLALRKGWHITSSNDDDGVAVAIEAVLNEQLAVKRNSGETPAKVTMTQCAR